MIDFPSSVVLVLSVQRSVAAGAFPVSAMYARCAVNGSRTWRTPGRVVTADRHRQREW
ncbi:hypothetical protein Jiend_60020 [Micromonospora endophytica]|nr:hypothetical protein Jiend_60020 [Micromonospora endophytica]